MNPIKKIKFVILALKHESELSLAYIQGNKKNKNDYQDPKVKHYGILFKIVGFIKFLLLNTTFKENYLNPSDVLFFAGTDNNANSMLSTIKALKHENIKASILIDKKVSGVNEIRQYGVTHVKWSLLSSLIIMGIFLVKGMNLWLKLTREKRKNEINNYFDKFCRSYAYIYYFNKIIEKAKPKLIIVANDHSVSCRSLRLVAELKGIKTMYFQHASVSHLFPPLEFDYALLDGEIAKKIYINNYLNMKERSERVIKNFEKCKIILSGQKRGIQNKNNNKKIPFVIGLAVNHMDSIDMVKSILNKFSLSKVLCVVRTHPNQPKIYLNELKLFISNNPTISWSNSSAEGLGSFLDKINCLIAANSSIHLEAALYGLPTFYLEINKNITHDYYSYVKNKISHLLNENFNIEEIIQLSMNKDVKERVEAIRKYSSTFNTKWQGREGEIVVKEIKDIIIKI